MAAPEGSRPLRADARRNREAVLRAAIAVLRTDPGASMDTIAEAAGVARRTAFRSFAGRDELVRAAHLTTLTAARAVLEAAAPPGEAARLEAVVAAALSIGEDYGLLITISPTTSDPDLRAELDAITRVLESAVAAARERGEVRRDLPVDWLALVLLQVIATVLETGPVTDPAARLDLVLTTYLHGVGGAPPTAFSIDFR
jgi:AcrR family transcriptional regulator